MRGFFTENVSKIQQHFSSSNEISYLSAFPGKAALLLLTLNAMCNSSCVSQGTIYGMLRLIEMENIRDLLFPFCATKQAESDHCGCNFLIM